MIRPLVCCVTPNKKRRALGSALRGRSLRLENETQARARTEGLLEKITVQAGGREWLLEIPVGNSEALVRVLVGESGPFRVGNIKRIKPELQCEALT